MTVERGVQYKFECDDCQIKIMVAINAPPRDERKIVERLLDTHVICPRCYAMLGRSHYNYSSGKWESVILGDSPSETLGDYTCPHGHTDSDECPDCCH